MATVLTISTMLASVFDYCMARATEMNEKDLEEDSEKEPTTAASAKEEKGFPFWAIYLLIGGIGILFFIGLLVIYYVLKKQADALGAELSMRKAEMLKKSKQPKEDESKKAVQVMMDSLTPPPQSSESDRERSKKEAVVAAEVKKQETAPKLPVKKAARTSGSVTPKSKSESATVSVESSSKSAAVSNKKKGPYAKKQPIPIKKQSVPPSSIKKQPIVEKDGGVKAKVLLNELTCALTSAKKQCGLPVLKK